MMLSSAAVLTPLPLSCFISSLTSTLPTSVFLTVVIALPVGLGSGRLVVVFFATLLAISLLLLLLHYLRDATDGRAEQRHRLGGQRLLLMGLPEPRGQARPRNSTLLREPDAGLVQRPPETLGRLRLAQTELDRERGLDQVLLIDLPQIVERLGPVLLGYAGLVVVLDPHVVRRQIAVGAYAEAADPGLVEHVRKCLLLDASNLLHDVEQVSLDVDPVEL